MIHFSFKKIGSAIRADNKQFSAGQQIDTNMYSNVDNGISVRIVPGFDLVGCSGLKNILFQPYGESRHDPFNDQNNKRKHKRCVFAEVFGGFVFIVPSFVGTKDNHRRPNLDTKLSQASEYDCTNCSTVNSFRTKC